MTTKTLSSVDGTRQWTGKYGPMVTINVVFDDGTRGEVNTKPDKVAERREALTKLIGVPGEYELEDQGKFDNGDAKPSRVTNYPGKPQGRGGGDGGNQPRMTPEERAAERTSIEAQVAFKGAVDFAVAEMARGDGRAVHSDDVVRWTGIFAKAIREAAGRSDARTSTGGASAPKSADEGQGGPTDSPSQATTRSEPPTPPPTRQGVEAAYKTDNLLLAAARGLFRGRTIESKDDLTDDDYEALWNAKVGAGA